MKLKQVKSEILELASKVEACEIGYNKAKNAKSNSELLKVIKKYIGWCIFNKITTSENLERWFDIEELQAHHIYTSGLKNIEINKKSVITVLGNANVNIVINTNKFFIYLAENSKVEILTYNKSETEIRTYPNIKTYDNSVVFIKNCEYNNIISKK